MIPFKKFIENIKEGFNIFPKARTIQRRSMPSPGPNINFPGPLPAGFKGAGAPGIAPGAETPVKIKITKKKSIIKPLRKG
jgi:hypothetical protein